MEKHYWAFLNQQQPLYWKGFCNKDRNEGIFEVERVVSKHGYILDFHMFSDLEINLKIEITEKNLALLFHDLSMVLDLQDTGTAFPETNLERSLFINITFTKSTGELKIEVPSVPG